MAEVAQSQTFAARIYKNHIEDFYPLYTFARFLSLQVEQLIAVSGAAICISKKAVDGKSGYRAARAITKLSQGEKSEIPGKASLVETIRQLRALGYSSRQILELTAEALRDLEG